MQGFFTDKLGEQVTGQDPDCGGRDQGQGGRQKDGQFAASPVGGKEHSGDLGFITELGQKDGSENSEKYFGVHFLAKYNVQ